MSFRQFRDGQLHERPLGARGRVEFPLLVNPLTADGYARTITRRVLVDPAHFRPRLPQRTSYTNLLLRAEEFSSSVWTKNEVTIADNQHANPADGRTSMATMLETSATAQHYIQQDLVTVDAVWNCFSFVVQPLGRDFVWFRLFGSSEGTTYRLQCSSGKLFPSTQVGSGFFGDVGAYLIAPDTWRVHIAANIGGATANVRIGTATSLSGSSNFAGDPTKGLIIWAAQVEQAASPGPLILTTGAARTVSAPDVDSIANAGRWPDLDPYAHLVWESPEPEDVGGGRWAVTRRYARIPRTTYEPRSELADLPSLHDVSSGSHYGVSWDEGRTSWIFSSRKSISAIQSLAAATKAITGTVTGTGSASQSPPYLENVTITFKGVSSTEHSFSTYNGAADIASRFSARSFTDAGCVRTNFRIEITWAGSMRLQYAYPSVDDAVKISATSNSLVIEPPDISDTSSASDTQAITETYSVPESRREFTLSSAHGVSAGDRVAFYNGDRIVALSTVATVVDTDTFSVPLKDVDGKDFAATHVVFGSQAFVRIVNGVADCSARLVRRFYLPGVSITDAGTTLAAAQDIPTFAAVFDPVSWLGVVVAYATTPSPGTYAIKSVEALASRDGLLLEKAVVEIQVQDAYRTISVTA